MDISLRRAAKIRSRLDRAITEQESLLGNPSLRVEVSDTDIPTQLNKKNEERRAILTKLMVLYRVRQVIRAALGRANVASGVSDLLAEFNHISQFRSLLERHYGHLDPTAHARPEDDKIEQRVEQKREIIGNAETGAVYTHVDFSFIPESDITELKTQREQLQAQEDAILDRIEGLNGSQVIHLDGPVVDSLKEVGIEL